MRGHLTLPPLPLTMYPTGMLFFPARLPPLNTALPFGAWGVVYVRLPVKQDSLASISAPLTMVIRDPPQSNTAGSKYTWTLEVPFAKPDAQKPHLTLSAPMNNEQWDHLDTKGQEFLNYIRLSVGCNEIAREA